MASTNTAHWALDGGGDASPIAGALF